MKSKLVQIKDGGHALFMQYPDKINRVLQTFLSTTPWYLHPELRYFYVLCLFPSQVVVALQVVHLT